MNSFAEILKAVAWPLSIIWIVYRFSDPITALISRIKSVKGPAGLAADFIDNLQQTIKHKTLKEYLEKVTPTPYEEEVLNNIHREIEDTDSARLKIALTLAYITVDFERLHTLIFGTQVQFLRHLSVDNNGKYEEYYEKHKLLVKDVPNIEPTVDNWTRFLFDNKLITKSSIGYSLTNKGVEFVNFLTKNYPNSSNKPF